jgi:suppressor of ftsI
VNFQNRLPLPSNLHVHGLHVSPTGNGDNIFVDVKPLTDHQYQYQIPLDQSPGAFWYHPHFHGYVDPELAAGLAGPIVVVGGLDKLMPKIPQRLIVLQGGKEVPPNNLPFLPVPGLPPGSIHPPPRPGPVELLVNGVQDPIAHIRPGELQRWRIFNATAERLLTLEMPGTTFQVLAQDGTTLRNMLPENVLHVAPGARIEVLVRGGAPGTSTLSAMPFRQCIKGCFDPFAGNLPNGRVSDKESLVTLVSAGTPVNDPLPANPIGNPPDLRGQPVDVQRTIVLSRVPNAQKAPFFPINHRLFNPSRVDITMKLNSIEEWTIENPATGPAYQSHSFHIHQNPFQVVSIGGKPVNYIDWQDDIDIHPGQSVKILIHPIDFTGEFVFHCHIAFHEDNGQMGTVQVLANPTPAQVNLNRVFYTHPVLSRSEFAGLNLKGVTYGQYVLFCHLHGVAV